MLTFPGWDCLPYDRASPALRVMAERLATLSALQAKQRQAAAAGRHRQRRYAAAADAVPNPSAHPPHRRGRAGRPRSPDQPAQRARLPARRHRRRAWRICGARLADRRLSRRRGAGAAARFLRRRDRQHPPLRSRRPALDRQGRRLHADAGIGGAARRRHASSASARATARRSARPRPRTRSTRRCPRAAAWPGWSIGCRCSRSGSRPCSIISARMT